MTFPLVLCDTNGSIEEWLVHQCYGVKVHDENDEIPDGRSHKLLPHGGLAALVRSNKRSDQAPRYFAYCFLPLPVRTPLPVHVNGHFAIDRGRRGLWKDADSNDILAQWNNIVMKHVLAPGYATLIREARNYIPFCERQGEDKTSVFFPIESAAGAGLAWYHNLFPNIQDEQWSALTVTLYIFLAQSKEPVLPVVVEDKPESSGRPENVPQRIRGWFSVQNVFFMYKDPNCLTLTATRMKTFLEIRLPIAGYSPMSIQQGFEKAECATRVVSPENVVEVLGNFDSTNAECEIGNLPCRIEDTTISNTGKLKTLISYCQRAQNIRVCLVGLPLLLTADGVLRVFSQEEKAYCSEFSDLFPKRADKFVHPEIVSLLSGDQSASSSEVTSEKATMMQQTRNRFLQFCFL